MKTRLYEIIIPTVYGDTLTKIPKKQHQLWDTFVQQVAGGLTIMAQSKGRWEFQGANYHEQVLPVRIMCTPNDIQKIVKFTQTHFRQKAVMFYQISDSVQIFYGE